MSLQYSTLSSAANALGEHNDCTVRALTAATGLEYAAVHAAMAQAGRKYRKGCVFSVVGRQAARALGFKVETLSRSEYSAKTTRTIAKDRKLRTGSYVVRVRGHVAALVDGQVIDWSPDNLRRVTAVFRVTKATSPAPAAAAAVPFRAFKRYTKNDQIKLF